MPASSMSPTLKPAPTSGPPVMLLHGWPYDIYSYVDVHRTIQGGIGHNLPQEAPQALLKLSSTVGPWNPA
jgi:hypothetical protein